MKEIESKLLSIKQLFSKDKDNKHPQFIVPEYQRAYAWWWSDKCDALWQDIVACVALPTTKSHFLGSVIIDKSDNTTLKLVDGQQRVTTFILLLKALLIRLNEKITILKPSTDSDTSKIRYKLEKRRDAILECLYIVNDDDIHEINSGAKPLSSFQIKYENRSMNETRKTELAKILREADFASAEAAVDKYKFKKGDNRYSNFFRNFQFFYKKFKEVEDSTELNDYAERILESCQAVIITSYDTEQAIEIFNSLNSKMLPLTDADILSAKLYENTPSADQGTFKTRWEKLRESVDGNDDKMAEILNQYMYTLRAREKNDGTTLPSVRSYFTDKTKGLLANSTEFVEALEKILKLWSPTAGTSLYNLQSLSMNFNSNFALFYIPYLYIKEKDSDDLKIQYANALIKLFALLELVETGYSSSKFKTKLFKINASLTTKSTSDIIADINAHIAKEFDRAAVEAYLKSNPVENSIVHLNDALYAIGKGLSIDFVVHPSINIEHIMPNSGKDKDAIRVDAGIGSTEEFRELVNLIGNKILLEENINKSIGRAWFVTKKQSTIASRAGYKNSGFPIATALVTYSKDEWKKADITTATEKATKRITDYIFDPNSLIK